MIRVVTVLTLAILGVACSGSSRSSGGGGGSATVDLGGATYAVDGVRFLMEVGDGGWFRIDGRPRDHADEDCVPGLSGGLGLYGELPASVRTPIDLVGKRLRVEFSGDGDDANFCFVGLGRLAGAEDAWVSVESVQAGLVTFSMSGTFKLYDEEGEGPVTSATARGTARLGEAD